MAQVPDNSDPERAGKVSEPAGNRRAHIDEQSGGIEYSPTVGELPNTVHQTKPPDTPLVGALPSTLHQSKPPDMPARPPLKELPGPSFPGYEVIERIGKGGMGTVYLARQVSLNRLVALKMMHGNGIVSDDELARFRLEAETVARLRHPNIVQIYDVGEAGGCSFISLEYVDGGSLDKLTGGKAQDFTRSAQWVEVLARAMHEVHLQGIIHRDLKLANVLTTNDGILKVTDFGLAKLFLQDRGETRTGQILGTPSYMAPEQAGGRTRDVGPATDIYSLGAILYELLTGRPPFKGENTLEIIHQVISDEPVSPRTQRRDVPFDLEVICLKCLEKLPQKRYRSALELADDLRRFQNREPISARPTPFWERGARWGRRNSEDALVRGLIVLFSILLLVTVLASTTYWLFNLTMVVATIGISGLFMLPRIGIPVVIVLSIGCLGLGYWDAFDDSPSALASRIQWHFAAAAATGVIARVGSRLRRTDLARTVFNAFAGAFFVSICTVVLLVAFRLDGDVVRVCLVISTLGGAAGTLLSKPLNAKD